MTNSNSSLLASQEKDICVQVSLSNQPPHNKRAQALLAINEGLSQVDAGRQVGLTAGQVRYWYQRFQQLRCEIFPAELQSQVATELQAKSETTSSSDKIKKQKKNKLGKKDKTKKNKDKKKKTDQKVKKSKKDKSKKKKDKNKKAKKKALNKKKSKKAKKKNR